MGLPSYCFLPRKSTLNLLDHSDDSPLVVTRSLLTAPKCHTSSRRCGGDRNGAINICQQTVDILSPPPPIYVAPSPSHAFMFCWASDSTTGRPPTPTTPSPPALWHSDLPIIAEVRIDWFHAPMHTVCRRARHPVCTGVSSESGPLPAPLACHLLRIT